MLSESRLRRDIGRIGSRLRRAERACARRFDIELTPSNREPSSLAMGVV